MQRSNKHLYLPPGRLLLSAILPGMILLSPLAALADDPNLWVEGQAQRRQKATDGTEVLVWIDRDIGGSFVYCLFADQASDACREMYGGPPVKPVPWLELGVGIRVKKDGNRRHHSAHFSVDGMSSGIYCIAG